MLFTSTPLLEETTAMDGVAGTRAWIERLEQRTLLAATAPAPVPAPPPVLVAPVGGINATPIPAGNIFGQPATSTAGASTGLTTPTIAAGLTSTSLLPTAPAPVVAAIGTLELSTSTAAASSVASSIFGNTLINGTGASAILDALQPIGSSTTGPASAIVPATPFSAGSTGPSFFIPVGFGSLSSANSGANFNGLVSLASALGI